MAERVERTERLLNLVIALMGTQRAMARSAIRAQVPGYASAASDTAFERMFERDKDDLRSMGVPLDTVADDSGAILGYRIARDDYAMQPIDLTIEERSALVIAAQAWGRASVAPVAGTAVRKIETAAGDPDTWMPSSLHGSVNLTATDAALLPLMQAMRTDRVVSFVYRAPSADDDQKRTVSPWRLASEGGFWRLSGFDHDRQAERTFRLSRIHGAVTVTSTPRTTPPASPPEQGDRGEERGVTARVRVAPGRGAGIRRAALDPDQAWAANELEVACATEEALVAAICAAGPDATVVHPPEIAAEVQRRLRQILDAHAAGTS